MIGRSRSRHIEFRLKSAKHICAKVGILIYRNSATLSTFIKGRRKTNRPIILYAAYFLSYNTIRIRSDGK